MSNSDIREPKTKPEQVVKRIILPVEKLMAAESTSGVLLIICTIIAVTWANSPFYESYFHLFHTPIKLQVGSFVLEHSLLHWINDALMVIFFFAVGMEIKRELVFGELSDVKRAALPIFAALGGMVVPALIYTFFNHGTPAISGWGIPMATDIAFAVGVLVLLGKRIPFALKVFLLALAIVDDLGAVLVIALFYTSELHINYLAVGMIIVGLIMFLTQVGIRNILVYFVLGTALWFCFLESGVHATIAGVILGFLAPVSNWVEKDQLAEKMTVLTQRLKELTKRKFDLAASGQQAVGGHGHSDPIQAEECQILHDMEFLAVESEAPLDRLTRILLPWVSFVIMPVFALANAGVRVEGVDLSSFLANPISIGVSTGLLLGKPIGIVLFSFIAVALGWAALPKRVTWSILTGVAILGGIGFTMALFVSNLALKGAETSMFSKLGILSGSLCAAVLGLVWLLVATRKLSEEN